MGTVRGLTIRRRDASAVVARSQFAGSWWKALCYGFIVLVRRFLGIDDQQTRCTRVRAQDFWGISLASSIVGQRNARRCYGLGLLALACGCSEPSCEETRTCRGDPPQTTIEANQPDASMTEGAADPASANDAAGTAACAAGQHECLNDCLPDDSPLSCGSSCSPCDVPTGGEATCDGVRCGGSCGVGEKLCLGVCVDLAAPCAGGCATGTHECGGQCPSDDSVNACGTSCDPCPVPAGALRATCELGLCDFQCMVGFHRCGDTCERDTDVRACGPNCEACPEIENGFPACNNRVCTTWCEPGFHVCNEQCVPDDSPLSCGTSACEPCSVPVGGIATCVDGLCGAECPSGQELCAGTCIDIGTACDGQCEAGTHDCGGLCVPDASVTQCGAACVSCPVPVGASGATCIAGECGTGPCRDGFHACGDACPLVDDEDACGPSCAVCPDDPNAERRTCQDDLCELECAASFHLCSDGACYANDAIEACGDLCQVCVPPLGGSAVCASTGCVDVCPEGSKVCSGVCIAEDAACDGQCPADTHNCNNRCVSDIDVNSCGPTRCTPCPAPPSSGVAVCADQACDIACSPGFHDCLGECLPDTSPESCGGRCAPCPLAVGGGAACVAGACELTCPGATHLCGNACVSDASPATCGDRCEACGATTPLCVNLTGGAGEQECLACQPLQGTRCNPSTGARESCSAVGTWALNACPASTPTCTGAGVCVCEEGAFRCAPGSTSNTEQCVGGAWTAASACPSPTPLCTGAGTAASMASLCVCQNGFSQCLPGNQLQVCAGTTLTTQACSVATSAATPICFDGDCVACNPAVPTSCSGSTLLTCNAAGTQSQAGCPVPTFGTGTATCTATASPPCGLNCTSGVRCGSECCNAAEPVCLGTGCAACDPAVPVQCDGTTVMRCSTLGLVSEQACPGPTAGAGTVTCNAAAANPCGINCADGSTLVGTACQTVDSTSPTILSVSPADGATSVRADTNVVITFSEPMNQMPTQGAFQSPDIGAAAFSWNATGTVLTVNPVAELPYAQVTVGTAVDILGFPAVEALAFQYAMGAGAQDLAGNQVLSPASATFQTLRRITQSFSNSGPGRSGLFILARTTSQISRLDPEDDDLFGIGDLLTNQGFGMLLVADLVFLAGPVTLVETAVVQGNQASLLGLPYTTLSGLQLSHVTFLASALPSGAPVCCPQVPYPANTNLGLIGTFSNSAALGLRSLSVVDEFAADVGNQAARGSTSQFSLNFATITDNDGVNDQAQFSSLFLTVTYLTP